MNNANYTVSAQTIGSWIVQFLDNYERTDFRKSGDHIITSERDLLKILKFFLLAKYPNLKPEVRAYKGGRIDFGFGKLRLEIVVKNKSGRGHLIVSQNRSEMLKLRKHNGPSVLALINMEQNSATDIDAIIKQYRKHSLGKGNHGPSRPITVLMIARHRRKYQMEKFTLQAPQ